MHVVEGRYFQVLRPWFQLLFHWEGEHLRLLAKGEKCTSEFIRVRSRSQNRLVGPTPMHPRGPCQGCGASLLFHSRVENYIASPEYEIRPPDDPFSPALLKRSYQGAWRMWSLCSWNTHSGPLKRGTITPVCQSPLSLGAMSTRTVWQCPESLGTLGGSHPPVWGFATEALFKPPQWRPTPEIGESTLVSP